MEAYGWLALVPPVLAIVLAIWTRQVIVSLFLGIFAGATIIAGWNPLEGLLNSFSTYLVSNSLADSWNIGIIVFCLVIGGMVGVIGKLGGTKAIATAVVRRAKSSRTTLLSTAVLGIIMFFDDYANTMIVGNTMRPITDEENISREKLAYVVDSTAAPVSSMAPVSTWIAMELGLIAAGLQSLNIEGNALLVFFQTVPFRFYSIFALILVITLIVTKKDYSLMYKAEYRARTTGQVVEPGTFPMITEDADILPDEGVEGSVWDAVVPIVIFILVTVFGLYYNGYEEGKTVIQAFGDADASVVLTWSAFIGSIIAIAMGLLRRVFSLKTAIDAWVGGIKSMVIAVIILSLAFALKSVISDMQLAEWLVEITEGILSGKILPLIVFVVAMLIAFSTGTSWGTNSILMPLVIPIAAGVSGAEGVLTPTIIASIGAVLTGAVFGDHCSPISDTTILSSMASGSDHISHVRTQIPYAVTAAVIAAVFGFIPAGFGVPVWLLLLLGTAAIILFVKFFGHRVEDSVETAA
ncbi:MAG: Na+/H+ antiporter NhaC family protein [Spirochaetaceae bacterium]|nr:Na+/H+ antiporter NhaC family protein [Spirochaetaceae bacterium]MCF7949615.1 Na+/H+ antiporter NhaC family protein [Spirochaetia bacterium]MCF7951970.1 Na+/H+ antiporter NhaC family protein [Spirochaetaceae bacterium]